MAFNFLTIFVLDFVQQLLAKMRTCLSDKGYQEFLNYLGIGPRGCHRILDSKNLLVEYRRVVATRLRAVLEAKPFGNNNEGRSISLKEVCSKTLFVL